MDSLGVVRSPSMFINDPWTKLRELTAARIALGRAGHSLPTRELLAFQMAHAKARDAVWRGLDVTTLARLNPIILHSAARDRAEYLRRPDLGRRLAPESATRLHLETRTTLEPAVVPRETRTTLEPAVDPPETRTTVRSGRGEWNAVIVIADGLSATAVHRHAGVLVDALLALLCGTNGTSTRVSTLHARVRAPQGSELDDWRVAPICVVEQGRVAIGDDIGERVLAQSTGAAMALVIIGERPGLSSPDSLGAYLTWSPRVGRTDAERNCVSNIRVGGLEPAIAAVRIAQLMDAARQRQVTGVGLSITFGDRDALP
jgi:ethanolamine ammonia-lyase small subunit